MYTSTCKFCGKHFLSRIKTSTCEECKPIDDELFSKIEEYLMRYPNSNAIQISEGLGIAAAEVLRYIDEGRLQIAKGAFQRL
ncbi:MAG: hypothetical protein ACI4FZ_09065 [Lachnospiraceae bacterium]